MLPTYFGSLRSGGAERTIEPLNVGVQKRRQDAQSLRGYDATAGGRY